MSLRPLTALGLLALGLLALGLLALLGCGPTAEPPSPPAPPSLAPAPTGTASEPTEAPVAEPTPAPGWDDDIPEPLGPEPLPPSGSARAPYAAILDHATSATAITLRETAMSQGGSHDDRIELRRGRRGFTAHVVCESMGQELSLDDAALRERELGTILERIATLPVSVGPFLSRLDSHFSGLDHSFSRRVELVTPEGTLRFETRSSPRIGDPWLITLGTEESHDDYALVDSPILTESFDALIALAAGERCTEWSRSRIDEMHARWRSPDPSAE